MRNRLRYHLPSPILHSLIFKDMSIIYLLIGCSITIAILFLIGFLWSIRSGQYDDTYTPAVRMLFDNTEGLAPEEKTKPESEASQPIA
jgi:cbb3-type cytochrome oxidase maturation protein